MWVTQLVVHHSHRGNGYASTLLRFLIVSVKPTIVGIASSHPHAILAVQSASKAVFDPKLMRSKLLDIITACNIPYLVDKPLIGNMLADTDTNTTGLNLQIDSGFYTDHSDPLEALNSLQDEVNWPLGPLLDGHEFIAIFAVGSRRDTPRIQASG